MSTFRAMNTDVTVRTPGADEVSVARAVARVFADAERRFSRFRDDSELAQLNRARGPMIVSAEMFDALVSARRYVELTDGIFEPAVGATLVAHGYDRSFEPGALDRENAAELPRRMRFLDVELEPSTRQVTRPDDLMIDLGGMIKGRTVDLAAAALPTTGAIDAGGDVVLRGGGAAGWPVHVEDPRDGTRTIAKLRVRDGAVATSAANRRRWRVGSSVRHHLVDPRTWSPAQTDLFQVTILASTAELADVLAKTVFVLGSERGTAFLARFPEVSAVLLQTSGDVVMVQP